MRMEKKRIFFTKNRQTLLRSLPVFLAGEDVSTLFFD